MEVIRINDLPTIPSPRGPKTRRVLSHPSVAITEVILGPFEELPAHKTPVDVFFYVRKGRGTVSIGNETQEVFEGSVVFSPMNIPHGLKALEEGFVVLVVKTPNPAYTNS